VNGLIGGWSVGGILTLQSGTPFRLSSGRSTLNAGDSGVVLAAGATVGQWYDISNTAAVRLDRRGAVVPGAVTRA